MVQGPVDPDRDVLDLVETGDLRAAVSLLMKRHGRAVYRYCRCALRDAALADDVLQHVFIAAFHDLPRFEGRTAVRVWLFAIAHHRVLDAAKARVRVQRYFEDATTTDTPDPRPSPAESIDDARLREALIASMGELDEHVRAAVLLRFQQNFSYEQMAAVCDEKAGTLQARVARALPVLRAFIKARMAGVRARRRRRSRRKRPRVHDEITPVE